MLSLKKVLLISVMVYVPILLIIIFGCHQVDAVTVVLICCHSCILYDTLLILKHRLSNTFIIIYTHYFNYVNLQLVFIYI